MKKVDFSFLTMMVCAVVFIMSSPAPAFSQAAGTDNCQDADRIQKRCNACVFTVNAYSRIDDDASGNEGTKKKWLRSVGTAVPIDENGHLMTLYSVVRDAEKVGIITHTGEKTPATVIGSDHTGRIAVLKIDPGLVMYVPDVVSINCVKPGDDIFFLGVVPGMSVSVCCGSIRKIRKCDGTIELTTSDNPGTSGTPIFDKNECIIGLLAFQVEADDDSVHADTADDVYIAVSLEYASVLAHRVIDEAKPKCGWLGVCIDLTDPGSNGLLIKGVIAGSPADRSELRPLDRIYEFNGVPVTTPHQFSDVFSRTKSGETVSLKIFRGDRRMSINVILTDRQ